MARGWVRLMLTSYEEKEERKNQRSVLRGFPDVFSLPENELIENYKISKDMLQYLCQELAEDLIPRTSLSCPVHVKILTALRILLDGQYQNVDGNVSVGQTTVSKYFHQFVTAVNARLKPKWIVFPGTEGTRQAVSSGYENKCGLPNILGAIDCTYVKIFPTPGFNDVQYLNPSGDMSINVQLIADADCRIPNVNANYPGRVHDAFMMPDADCRIPNVNANYPGRVHDAFMMPDADCRIPNVNANYPGRVHDAFMMPDADCRIPNVNANYPGRVHDAFMMPDADCRIPNVNANYPGRVHDAFMMPDADCRIPNVNANYPGRVHDQFIFDNSVVKEELKRLYSNKIGQYYLLGNSSYALEPWLMTPIMGAAADSPEKLYTNWHCQTRNAVERTNDYLKGTFRSLGMDRSLHYSPEKSSQLIYACCTLYNIMKNFRVPLSTSQNQPQATQEEQVPGGDDQPQHNATLLQSAREIRENIVNRYFAQI